MIIKKFGKIIEINGDLRLEDFEIDFEGQTVDVAWNLVRLEIIRRLSEKSPLPFTDSATALKHSDYEFRIDAGEKQEGGAL